MSTVYNIINTTISNRINTKLGVTKPLNKNTMKTTNIETAKYIINTVKSVGKTKEYALDIVCWYSMTDKDDKEISEYINTNF